MAGLGKLMGRRAGVIGIALTTYDLWRRLPPEYRKRAIRLARTHGPPLALYVREQFNEFRRRQSQKPKP